MPRSRKLLAAITACLTVAGLGSAATSPANADTGPTTPVVTSLVDAVPGLADLTLPASLTGALAGLPNGPLRDYGTPTAAPAKVCPFVGNIPVSLPIVNSPLGTSIPGFNGISLDQPSVSTYVHGELCMSTNALTQARNGNPPSVLLLNHGITYGTYYWDFPYQPDKYSTVNHLNTLGFATLNIDRVGDGASGHPLSPLVNAQSEAVVTHELIQKLKAGGIGGLNLPHVGLVGHSYGTVINWVESAMYNDADVNIGTGYSDRVDPVSAGEFIGLSTPALASPLQADQPWAVDPGYLQPLSTARNIPQLYYPGDADPQAIATDAALANTVTVGEIATFVEREYDGTHKGIRIPTFDVQGENDILTCGQNADECQTDATTSDDPVTLEKHSTRFTAWQGTAFGPQACFRSAVVPLASHDVSLASNAAQTQATIAFFALQAMGVRGENTAHYTSTCAARGPSVFDTLPEITRLIPPFPYSSAPIWSGVLQPIIGALLGG